MSIVIVNNKLELKNLVESLVERFHQTRVIELIGDLGTGKTTLVKLICEQMEVIDEVGSPSFTIENIYETKSGERIHHYDFHRASDPGIMRNELIEVLNSKELVIVEWASVVADLLPPQRITIKLSYQDQEDARKIEIN